MKSSSNTRKPRRSHKERIKTWKIDIPVLRAEGLKNSQVKEEEEVRYNMKELWEGTYYIEKRLDKETYIVYDDKGNKDLLHGNRLVYYRQVDRMIPQVNVVC
ncbi:hypothetical protein BB559_001190 [Furculomyces boomerangus]|uniref:Uncharacterized protein n=1 Tax=Furculomyces boomerangus TaxID=61424 RepID=A0A2T9Z2S5_9FUNG|nr:hypothetical protein BB559_001190 [Furculomyces boomerangus]